MDRGIKESDWKIFRELRKVALERFCQRVLDAVTQTASRKNQTSHERYTKIYRLVKHKDGELADMFDAPRRSAAITQLARMIYQKLLDEEEYLKFSPETRASVEGFIEMWKS